MSAIDDFTNHYVKPTTGVQEALKKLGYDPGAVNGTVTPSTQDAIRRFQQDNGLTIDGSLTPQTQAAITKASNGQAPPADGQEHLLEQKTTSPTPAIPGMKTGQVQALGLGGLQNIPGVSDLEKKIEDVLTKPRTYTIIFTNKSNQVLRKKGDPHLAWGDWQSGQGPPLEIEAAKDGKPGVATMVWKSTKLAVGKLHDTVIENMVYEIQDDTKSKITMNVKRTGVKADTTHSEKVEPSGAYKIDGAKKDNDTFEFVLTGEGDDKGKDTSDVSCRITIDNQSKYDLKLVQAKNDLGDFATNPPDTLPAGKKAEFLYVQTPHEKDPKKEACKGFLIYDVGSPSVAKWRCDWDNPKGEKNAAESKIDPQVPGLKAVGVADQGDENVPFNFTLSSEATAGVHVTIPIGPFKTGFADKLESADLQKTIYDILHKQLPAATREAFGQGQAGGTTIVVHGYASSLGPEINNLDLSLRRANKVIELFKKLGAPASVFPSPIPHGEWETEKPTDDRSQENDDAKWRRVDLDVTVK